MARDDRRPFDELLQLYTLEGFLRRMAQSDSAANLILKGGVLLASLGERRPTRDIDLQAEHLDNDAEAMKLLICGIAATDIDDGLTFDVDAASTKVIRDEDAYSGVRDAPIERQGILTQREALHA